MHDDLWDPDDGPDPREYDYLAEWTDGEWQAWYDEQGGPSFTDGPPLRAVISIDPSPYL